MIYNTCLDFSIMCGICPDFNYNNNNNDRLTAFDPGQPG